MSRQDDQLQEKLQHIETELSAEAEKLRWKIRYRH